MNIFKCDRCKQEGKQNTIALFSWRYQKIQKLFGKRFQLCDKCFKKLVKFLNE